MPHTHHNSSSLARKDEYQVYTPPPYEEFTEEKSSSEVVEDSEKLHHGTEELLDALPKVWSRSLLYVFVGFIAVAIPWSMVSTVDETGSAIGRIEPFGAIRKLDSIAGGSVTAVKVKEGDRVRAGQILLELDNDTVKPELERTKEKLAGSKNQVSQLELLKKQIELTINTQEQQNQSQALEKKAQVNQAIQNLNAKQSTYNLQKLEKQALVNQAKQQIETNINERKSAQARLDIDKNQVERYSKLLTDGAVSAAQIDSLRKEQQESKRVYQKTESDIKQAQLSLVEETNRYQTTMNQLESDIEQAKLQLAEQNSGYQSAVNAGKLALLKTTEQIKDLQRQINLTKSEIAQTKSDITSLNIQMQQRIVRSPIDGVVFELPVSKPGEVLQPGQRIARIAPKDSGFVLRATMPVKETGFLKTGMPVKVKFDAYPFQEYGIVPGKVSWISPDSKAEQATPGSPEIYELRITLNKPYIENGDRRIPLTAGQTAQAEVIVRQRRAIDFLLDPFKKLQKGGLEL
ncbi:HlyD family efflux transporter periplasmic adaptor subunit [Rivularia sp. UHCC 0363]|uniref:HlyD family efflux transporter periplasmic adaptor subunit n=1 Tax=Rivularia sp. UHCC 0363 TaxID=3110244 RepID=UPI002B1FAAA5|nr:HlyD family efflux transporter periplasmic adaptor subunit [Rivularia sp. UHCC 0363]MEA5597860.1 HlyD family efflux transporter periplasmic adaptor subunit [Rivularia sp. UHCC 0363]